MNIIEFTHQINDHDVKFYVTAPTNVTLTQFEALVVRTVIETLALENKLRAQS